MRYSVPFGLIRQKVDLRLTRATVEIFHCGRRVASHTRNPGRRSHVTVPDHMPSSHRRYVEWIPARILASAEKPRPSVAAFCQIVMEDRQGRGSTIVTSQLPYSIGWSTTLTASISQETACDKR